MECNRCDDLAAEAKEKEKVNTQCDPGRVRGDRGRADRRVGCKDQVLGNRGIDSSLLFFFLLLILIVCQSDCDIELETLLWFFLLLVALYNWAFLFTYRRKNWVRYKKTCLSPGRFIFCFVASVID